MRVFISAGEPSGDLYGALIAKELKKYGEISGMGGELMEKTGVKLIKTLKDLSVFGFYEGLISYPRVKKTFNEILSYLHKNPPDIFIPIAFSEFHLFLLQRLSSIKTYYFGPPQLWAWGEWRKYFLRRKVDKIICLFPFEQGFFKKRGIDAVYLGNPLIDCIKVMKSKKELLVEYGLSQNTRILTLMPGSRREEIRRHLPLMLKIFHNLKRNSPDEVKGFIISKGKPSSSSEGVIYTQKDKYDIMAHSELILLASGTAALESAILETPFVSIYKLSPMSWIFAKALVRLKRFSLPNIIASDDVVPEYAQPDFKTLYPVVFNLFNNPIKREEIKEGLRRAKRLLGSKGAIERIVNFITDANY